MIPAWVPPLEDGVDDGVNEGDHAGSGPEVGEGHQSQKGRLEAAFTADERHIEVEVA